MKMTPSRKANNKHYSYSTEMSNMSGSGRVGTIKSNSSSSSSCYSQNHAHSRFQHRGSVTGNKGIVNNSSDEKYSQSHPHPPSHSQYNSTSNNQRTFRKQSKINRNDGEFIPQFVLVEAARENSDRKVREICAKLKMLDYEEAASVVNFQDQTGRTALSYGCGCGNIHIIDEISRFSFANPNLADNDGNAPLHYSSVCGHSEGVDLLLTRFHGVIDVNTRNVSGLTPLMKAALQGRTRCAKSLLAAGACPHLKDHIRGLTAAEWAKLCGRHMCAEIIGRSALGSEDSSSSSPGRDSSIVHSRTLPNLQFTDDRGRKHLGSDEAAYYHLYARSTVNGAKWLKNKIKKALGGVRSGEDKSYVYDNPALRSLADRRPTLPQDRNFSVLTNLGLGGATICASSLLLPDIQPIVNHSQQRQQRQQKLPIPVVHITPVRR